MRRTTTVLTVLGLAVAALATVASPASAGDKSPSTPPPRTASAAVGPVPVGFSSWPDVYAYQVRLNALAEAILGAGDPGNPSVVAAPRNHELRVYWKGTVPAAVRDVVAHSDIPVTFLPARFSHAELVEQGRRLAADPRVVEVVPQYDGSGLAVTVDAAVATGDRVGLGAGIAVPLSLTTGERARPTFSRSQDIPGFYGGSTYSTSLGSCSNGFPLFSASSSNVYMMTAGHCGTVNGAVDITGQPSPTGLFQAKSTCADAAVIRYPAGVLPSVYIGSPTSSARADVAGTTIDFVGNLVVSDGALTGEHDNITVNGVDVFAGVATIPCASVGPFTRASYSDASCAIAPGDSGGPVFSYVTALTVQARGTMSAGQFGTGNCSVPNGSNVMLYAPLVRPSGGPQLGTLARFGMDVLTCATCAPTLVTVPHVEGQLRPAATATITAAGLQALIAMVPDPNCNFVNRVGSENPPAGTQVLPGSAVTLNIGIKPPVCP